MHFRVELLTERVFSVVSAIAFRRTKQSIDADPIATGSCEPMRKVLRFSGAARVNVL
jgi:hypothetical protein